MPKKKGSSKAKVSIFGTNATTVTGSMTLIECNNLKILVEAGIHQSSNLKNDYLINSRPFPFDPKSIDFILIGHVHGDHTFLLPRLYKAGCQAPIIAPKGSHLLLHHMLSDCAKINSRDITTINKQTGKHYLPLYDQDDVDNTLNRIEEFDCGQKIDIHKNMSIKFIPSGHILGAAQIEIHIKAEHGTKHILYTSDLGNVAFPKYYVTPFEKGKGFYDLVIGESTYGGKTTKFTGKHRKNDLTTLRYAIDSTMAKRGKVLLPSFSLDKTQYFLTILYNLYKDDPEFKAKIIVDSKLATLICQSYIRLLKDDDYELFSSVLNWDKVCLVEDFESHMRYLDSEDPLVVLAAPGFLTMGRSVEWVKKLIENENNAIVFTGYAPENSLAGKLKRECNKYISIDGKPYKNNVRIFFLQTFSSHMQHHDLVKYYSSLKTNNIILVHGDPECKKALHEALEDAKSKCGNTAKIEMSHKNHVFYI